MYQVTAPPEYWLYGLGLVCVMMTRHISRVAEVVGPCAWRSYCKGGTAVNGGQGGESPCAWCSYCKDGAAANGGLSVRSPCTWCSYWKGRRRVSVHHLSQLSRLTYITIHKYDLHPTCYAPNSGHHYAHI